MLEIGEMQARSHVTRGVLLLSRVAFAPRAALDQTVRANGRPSGRGLEGTSASERRGARFVTSVASDSARAMDGLSRGSSWAGAIWVYGRHLERLWAARPAVISTEPLRRFLSVRRVAQVSLAGNRSRRARLLASGAYSWRSRESPISQIVGGQRPTNSARRSALPRSS